MLADMVGNSALRAYARESRSYGMPQVMLMMMMIVDNNAALAIIKCRLPQYLLNIVTKYIAKHIPLDTPSCSRSPNDDGTGPSTTEYQ